MATEASTVRVGVVATDDATADHHSSIDWSAIIAGAVLATAITFVLLTFGSALGLTLTSPFEGEGTSAILLGIAAALWFIWVQVSSFMAGAYLAGRMRRRLWNATEHEVEVRDGAQGLMVWAVGMLLGAMLATSTAVGVVDKAADATATVVAGAVSGDSAQSGSNGGADLNFVVDTLFRTETAPVAPGSEAARQEILRILTRSAAAGEISEDDKTYIARVVATRTELSQEQAAERVNTVLTQAETAMRSAVADAKMAAERARKIAIIIGFFMAATFLVSAAAAWWAASIGGKHRDEGRVFNQLALWR